MPYRYPDKSLSLQFIVLIWVVITGPDCKCSINNASSSGAGTSCSCDVKGSLLKLSVLLIDDNSMTTLRLTCFDDWFHFLHFCWKISDAEDTPKVKHCNSFWGLVNVCFFFGLVVLLQLQVGLTHVQFRKGGTMGPSNKGCVESCTSVVVSALQPRNTPRCSLGTSLKGQ